ncbi:unnamed protein product [Orchesella dallaii]|uniref:Uncharacterized protein n=1 Tax=Orchesella dallaii TaxID=48710 RepID=A0ABP1RG22_9HEXA
MVVVFLIYVYTITPIPHEYKLKLEIQTYRIPVRPTGENEIVLAVTQRRENVARGSLNRQRNNHAEPISRTHRPYPHPLTRHQSLLNQSRRTTLASWSDFPSPLVSNLSSLQSLLMSSQVAVFNSSTERLSLSSQNQAQLIFQPISMHQQLLQQQLGDGATGNQVGAASPYSVSPAISNSSIHLPQPSYFDDPPPTYEQSMLIRKLRASNRSAGSGLPPPASQRHNAHFNAAFPSSRMGLPNSRRSCRM